MPSLNDNLKKIEFQFQSGTIKSCHVLHFPCRPMQSFNSNLVQLKVTFTEAEARISEQSFNSNLVQLKEL